jgi:putative endonuclease
MTDRDPRHALGRAAEAWAVAYLEQQNYTILARNWRIRGGELDIVARDGAWLVFVEVRSRRGDALGAPEESITPRKQARLAHLAEAYLEDCGWDGPWRIDVLALCYRPDGALAEHKHFVDAIGR